MRRRNCAQWASNADTAILAHAHASGSVIVTLDADFHAALMISQAQSPSVIRLRMQSLNGASLLMNTMRNYTTELLLTTAQAPFRGVPKNNPHRTNNIQNPQPKTGTPA